MHRSDATHVAVGAAFLGVGSVTLGILIPLAAAAESHPWTAIWFLLPCIAAGILGLVGLYMLSAVYTGWWLPETAGEREGAPNLKAERAELVRVEGSHVYFSVGFDNQGRGDIDKGGLNLLVPAFVTSLDHTDIRGNLVGRGTTFQVPESIFTDGDGKEWSSLCWAGSFDFPGRTARPIYFRAIVEPTRDIPIRVIVVAEELHGPLERFLWVNTSRGEGDDSRSHKGEPEARQDG